LGRCAATRQSKAILGRFHELSRYSFLCGLYLANLPVTSFKIPSLVLATDENELELVMELLRGAVMQPSFGLQDVFNFANAATH
jgi:hypothetical protein